MSDGIIYEQRIKAALNTLAAMPSRDNYANLAKCYLDAAESYAIASNWKDFYDCLECVRLMSLRSNYYNKLIVNKIANICFKCRYIVTNSEVVDSLFDLVANLDLEADKKLRKKIFNAFHWFAKFWDAYLDFCDWWCFENFEETDFQVVKHRDSLAESAYIAYSRCLAWHTAAEYMFDFYIDFIKNMLSHDFTVYADYHIAGFMLKVGFPTDDVLRAFRRYIKQKHGKVWSWVLLSHLFDTESIEHQACILFAQECDGSLEKDYSTIDYRTICHNLFADVQDADTVFWEYVLHRLQHMRDSGKWYERKWWDKDKTHKSLSTPDGYNQPQNNNTEFNECKSD